MPSSTRQGVDAPLKPGREIGGYRLLFRLGKGGMGEVWAAVRTQSELGFSKLVALKILQGHDLTSNAAVMFFDEARAAGALHHPHIVPTVDLGRDGSTLFIAMEIVQGPSLTALLQRLVRDERRMSPGLVAHLGLAIASALDYAHRHATHQGRALRLIHRDISPHNVLLDVNGAIRLTDFGIARSAIQDHESRVGTVRGKPSYMAPEQVAGRQIDGRTDLFALGIVLYESSCLRRLFGRSNAIKSMDAVLNHTPRRLSTFVPSYPEPLWRVIERALQKDPKARFQDAGEMHDALHHAACELDSFPGAGRELMGLIEQAFEPGAFDTEARVAHTRMFPSPDEEPTRPPGEATPRNLPALEPTRAWPSAEGREALAPETTPSATVFSPATPSGTPPAAGTVSPLGADLTSGTESGILFVSPALRRRGPLAALVLTALAGILATTALLVAQNRKPVETRVTVRGPAAPVAPAARSGRAAEPMAKPRPRDLPPAADSPANAPSAGASTNAPSAGAGEHRGPTARHSRKTSAPSKDDPGDATFEEVRALLKRVRDVDPARGHAMFVTFAEAGRQNVDTLNQLRHEAQSILRDARR